jgi:excisionase family DNA binding protein
MATLTQHTPLLTTDEAAKLLSIQPKTLAYWRCVKRYTLPYVKVGKSCRYRRSDIDAFIESRTVA